MDSARLQTHKPDFPSLLERYFCEYLLKQRNASPETISSYRDTFRLFLQFSEQRFRKAPASLTLADLDAPQILAFLVRSQPESASSRPPFVSPLRGVAGSGRPGFNHSRPCHPCQTLRQRSCVLSLTR